MLTARDEWRRLSDTTRDAVILRSAEVALSVIADFPRRLRWLVRLMFRCRPVYLLATRAYFQGQLDAAYAQDVRRQQEQPVDIAVPPSPIVI